MMVDQIGMSRARVGVAGSAVALHGWLGAGGRELCATVVWAPAVRPHAASSSATNTRPIHPLVLRMSITSLACLVDCWVTLRRRGSRLRRAGCAAAAYAERWS